MRKTEQRVLCFPVALGRDYEQGEIAKTPNHSPWGSSRGGFLELQEEITLREESDLGGCRVYRIWLPLWDQAGSQQETEGHLK